MEILSAISQLLLTKCSLAYNNKIELMCTFLWFDARFQVASVNTWCSIDPAERRVEQSQIVKPCQKMETITELQIVELLHLVTTVNAETLSNATLSVEVTPYIFICLMATYSGSGLQILNNQIF